MKILLIALIAIVFAQIDEKWLYVGTTEKENYYIDTTTIEKTPEKRGARIWVKTEPAEGFLSFIREEKKELNKKFIHLDRQGNEMWDYLGYDYYDHTLTLYQIDCTSRRIKAFSVIDYDFNGNVLRSESQENGYSWEYVVPGSIGEKLYYTLCGKKKK